MDILTGEATLLFLPLFSVRVNSYGKEFAPLSVNSFLKSLFNVKEL